MSAAVDATVLDDRLQQGAAALGLALSAQQRGQLLQHLALIERWNRVYNLTAVREPDAMLAQHLLDSLAIVSALQRELPAQGGAVLDVGSGAGLPGAVIAVACPGVLVTCVDAVAKKAGFIRQAAAELGLPNLVAEHARVETLRPRPWQIITARAFASLAELVRLTRALLDERGCWAAMKGQVPDGEILELPSDIEVFHVEHVKVPNLEAQRCVVWMRLKRELP